VPELRRRQVAAPDLCPLRLLQGQGNCCKGPGDYLSEDSIESKVIQIIAEQLSLREDEIKAESRFVDDLGADSLDIVELIMEMEEEFDIEIPDEEVEKMITVQDVVSYISQHVTVE
jgi:acyl carrier protein